MSGMVYLVGAGPGDPGVFTVKGLELIKKADCIVYDRLSSPELLDYARQDCECIYAGKADSHHTMPQEEINGLLVRKAKQYRLVVRLKVGDPYVFGRGGEEGLYLMEHGISFGVVPGVSSAIAGAAYAGIPVTHRGMATSFRVITVHRRAEEKEALHAVVDGEYMLGQGTLHRRSGEDRKQQISSKLSQEMTQETYRETELPLDYSTMLDEKETLIFLMGLRRVGQIAKGLMAAGRSGSTPVAVISKATTPEQKTCVGTLADIEGRVWEMGLPSPAMIVVGSVVSLRESLNIYEKKPLFGKRYLVPKIGEEPSRLSQALKDRGAFVKEVMVGRITGISARYTRQELSGVDLLIFTSANGVKYFMRNLFASGLDVRVLSRIRLVVIGQKTAEKLREYGLTADLIPEKYDSDSLAEEIRADLTAHPIENNDIFHRPIAWYPAAKNAGDDLVDALLSVCDCGRLNVYENVACGLQGHGTSIIGKNDKAENIAGKAADHLVEDISGKDTDYFAGNIREVAEEELMFYDGIFFTCASSAERLFAGKSSEFLARLAENTKLYSIGPKCSHALTNMGAAPLVEANPHTYEGLLHLVN